MLSVYEILKKAEVIRKCSNCEGSGDCEWCGRTGSRPAKHDGADEWLTLEELDKIYCLGTLPEDISKSLDDLAADGLIVMEPDEDDCTQLNISVTAAGKTLIYNVTDDAEDLRWRE